MTNTERTHSFHHFSVSFQFISTVKPGGNRTTSLASVCYCEADSNATRTTHRHRSFEMPVNILLCASSLRCQWSRAALEYDRHNGQSSGNTSPWRIQFNVCCCRCELKLKLSFILAFSTSLHSSLSPYLGMLCDWGRVRTIVCIVDLVYMAVGGAHNKQKYAKRTKRKRRRRTENERK